MAVATHNLNAKKNPSGLTIAGVFSLARDRPASPGTGADVSALGYRVHGA